jgi:tetraacyldisaccharide 4'-kinase
MPNVDAYLRLIRGETRGPLAITARLGLGAASRGYAIGVALRNRGYDRGVKEIVRVDAPVVSVGNITLGGTGKTPMVEWVARWFRERDVRVAILSRGYRQGNSSGVNDEAMVLEENLPDVPHLQHADRAAIAVTAVEELESQVLVLDDGFQHRRLARDLDIVLLDALDPFGLGRLFPRGLLREPIASLRRSGIVVISRSDLVGKEELDRIRARAERAAGTLKWVHACHKPVALIGQDVEPIASLEGKRVAAFCGIGNPEGFQRTLEPLCAAVRTVRRFPDHHAYNAKDVDDLIEWSRALDVDLVLTTQKDLVKLRIATLGALPLRALRIGLEVVEGAETLESALAAISP